MVLKLAIEQEDGGQETDSSDQSMSISTVSDNKERYDGKHPSEAKSPKQSMIELAPADALAKHTSKRSLSPSSNSSAPCETIIIYN